MQSVPEPLAHLQQEEVDTDQEDHVMDSATDTDVGTSTPPKETPVVEGYRQTEPTETRSGKTAENRQHKPRGTYAQVTARGGKPSSGDGDPPNEEDAEGEVDKFPGPIKGFDARKIYDNLNGQVQQAWERKAETAIFVHHLDSGYGPNMAMNVRVIAGELRSTSPFMPERCLPASN